MTGRQPSGKVAPDCSPLLIRPHHHCKTHHQPNQVSNCPFASVSAWQTGVQLKVIYVEIVTMLKLLQRCATLVMQIDTTFRRELIETLDVA